MTKKNLTLMVAVAILIIALITLLITFPTKGEGKQETTTNNLIMEHTVMLAEKYIEEQKQVKKEKVEITIIEYINSKEIKEVSIESVTVEDEIPKRPYIKDIPLSDELLDYTYDLAIKNGISFELVLGIMKTESNFDPNVVSETRDYGLLQINKSNIKSFAKAAGISNVNPLDPEDNIAMGIYYLGYLRDKWLNLGYSEEDTYFLTILGFNRGEGNAQKYVRNGKWSNSYVSKVNKNKALIEANMEA